MKTRAGASLFLLFLLLSLATGILIGVKIFFWDKQAKVTINKQTIYLEIADTPEKISQGLSGRISLDQQRGMLFVFEKPGNYPFWMEKMKFNLDLVFINNNQVVDIAEDVSFPKPGENPLTINSKSLFDKVLEINRGKIREWGIKVGDKLEIYL